MNNSELKLADVVLREVHPELGISAVQQIKDGLITFFRPYPHTGDFSHTGGVTCYTGVETWTEAVDDNRSNWTLIQRKDIR